MFSNRLRGQDTILPAESLTKLLPVKKASLFSERLAVHEKDFTPKELVRSQMSLVDPDASVKERLKRLSRQHSFEKQTFSQKLSVSK